MANKEKSQISPAAERPVAKDSIMSMDEKARKPQVDTAEAARLFEKLPADAQAAILELMKGLLAESEVDAALLQDRVGGMP